MLNSDKAIVMIDKRMITIKIKGGGLKLLTGMKDAKIGLRSGIQVVVSLLKRRNYFETVKREYH